MPEVFDTKRQIQFWYFGPAQREGEDDRAYRVRFVREMCKHFLRSDDKSVDAHIDWFQLHREDKGG